MANFDNFKQLAKDAAGTIADVSVELYKRAEEKTKVIAKTTKLNSEISRERNLIRRLYSETGKQYYALHKDDAEGALAQNCAEITFGFERIAAKQREIEEIKAAANVKDEDIEVEIEVEIIAEDDDACDCECDCDCTDAAKEAAADAPAEEKAEEACSCDCDCDAPDDATKED